MLCITSAFAQSEKIISKKLNNHKFFFYPLQSFKIIIFLLTEILQCLITPISVLKSVY